MDKKHILVVDDEQNLLYTIEFILGAANYKVTTSANGQDALEKIQAVKDSGTPIDLLITDIRMPGLTGIQLIDELNRLNLKIPILVITGYGDRELVTGLMRKGCADYLDKPFDDEEFVKRVSLLFERESERFGRGTNPQQNETSIAQHKRVNVEPFSA